MSVIAPAREAQRSLEIQGAVSLYLEKAGQLQLLSGVLLYIGADLPSGLAVNVLRPTFDKWKHYSKTAALCVLMKELQESLAPEVTLSFRTVTSQALDGEMPALAAETGNTPLEVVVF